VQCRVQGGSRGGDAVELYGRRGIVLWLTDQCLVQRRGHCGLQPLVVDVVRTFDARYRELSYRRTVSVKNNAPSVARPSILNQIPSYIIKTGNPSRAKRPIGLKRHWSLFPSPSARHQFTLLDHGYGASASRGGPVDVSAFTSTHSIYPRRDGQGEWICMAGYIPIWFTRLLTVTHPSINQQVDQLRRWDQRR